MSLPMTVTPTCMTASGMTGFTFPGIIDEPGWTGGRFSSLRPVWGPEPSHRRSFAILIVDTATARIAPLASTRASWDAWASKWFSATRNFVSVAALIFSTTRPGNSGCALIPVPTAVPPIASSARAARQDDTRRIPWSIWDWYPENSWPRRIGVASIKWVRPDFTIGSNSFDFFARLSSSSRRAGSRLWSISMRAATWIAVGITSFEDWPRFTWSSVCLGRRHLDQAERIEEAPTEADPADREIFDGPLRLGAPVGVLGDFQFTQEVLLDAVVGHARCVRTERGEH